MAGGFTYFFNPTYEWWWLNHPGQVQQELLVLQNLVPGSVSEDAGNDLLHPCG